MLNIELKKERATALLNAYNAVRALRRQASDNLTKGLTENRYKEAVTARVDMYTEILDLLEDFEYNI